MAYAHTITCLVAAPLSAIAAHVGRALDPDTGGGASFGLQASKTGQEPVTHLVMDTRCVEGFAQAAPWLLNAEMLLGSIERDYAQRWPDVPVPSLDEVQTFIDGCVLVVDQGLDAVLADNGLTRITNSE